MFSFFLYTDPGSGMMLLQLLLATLAGAFYYFRSFFFRIFGRKNKLVQAESDPPITEENSIK